MWERRWVRWGVVLGCWTLLAGFFATQTYITYSYYPDSDITFLKALKPALAEWYVWAALTPLVLWLARRFPLERGRWRRALLVHLPASVLVVFAKLAGELAVRALVPGLSTRVNLANKFHPNFLTYWAILGISLGFVYYRKYRERELRASQLEAKLALAELQVLKMQLHPHFLFNTLHAISTLMHRDVEAAERMLARLSDLLRVTLDNVGVQEVSLKEELEFLDRYLDIEKARFGDRLTVRQQIDPATLDARVPYLILQPLVENAVRHGIAPRSAPGRIEILARQEDGRLRLRVSDDGTGLPGGRPDALKEGLGLANTRARLEQLYGDAQSFELANGPERGLVVTLTLPFRVAEQPSAAGD